MASTTTKSLLLVFFLVLSFASVLTAEKKSYVVYLGAHPHAREKVTLDVLDRVTHSHHNFLASILGTSIETARDAIFYSYKRHINGFAATLDDQDAQKLANHPDVVSVIPNRGANLHTTHSWNFMMLEDAHGRVPPHSLWNMSNFGKDVIVANLDTGVWPESLSFTDHGFGPIPSKWRGSCHNSSDVPCNRKLIGARFYNKGYLEATHFQATGILNTAKDHAGHGSHTLSTAAGNYVEKASLLGLPLGTAKGGSPGARVASYKVCWPPFNDNQCVDADMVAAFDRAIYDGVDVISLSLGGDPINYLDDVIAIGAFHAVQHNIVVVASAGNSGPFPATVSNLAPWIITVAASTIDREFHSAVELLNGLLIKGESLSKGFPKKKFYPLIHAGMAKLANSSYKEAELCSPGSIEREKVKGKILLCKRGVTDRVAKGYQAHLLGAAGMILYNDASTGNEIEADPHFLPAIHVTYKDSLSLFAYMNSTKDPKAYIQPPQILLHNKPAPQLALFSSRGPNSITPGILKPDIVAPGVGIIAAFSQGVPAGSGFTEEPFDTRQTPFAILDGTSMSCPHVTGVVALLKKLHPDWSPAAIKSAIMTTGRSRDNTMKPMQDVSNKQVSTKTTPFGYGGGHLRPNRAMDPGLVYDLSIKDHMDFLCGIGYNKTVVRNLAKEADFECPKKEEFSIKDYNYPSISITNLEAHKHHVKVKRKLKNVGSPGTYVARLRAPFGVSLSVEPGTLRFDKIGEEKSFELSVTRVSNVNRSSSSYHGFGQLLWSDGKHYVRSPIAISFGKN